MKTLFTILPLVALCLFSGCNQNDGVKPDTSTNAIPSTNAAMSGFSPYELAIIAGASNGTYAAMLSFNERHGITNPPPALVFEERNPIGSFTAQYIDYTLNK